MKYISNEPKDQEPGLYALALTMLIALVIIGLYPIWMFILMACGVGNLL